MTTIRRGRVTVLSHDKTQAGPLDMVIHSEEPVLASVPGTASACSDGRRLVIALISGTNHGRNTIQYMGMA